MNPPTFKAAFHRAITDAIHAMKRDGMTKASADCLYQNVRTGPLSFLPDAPRGTNAAWQVRQCFNDIITDSKISPFILA